MVAGTKRFIFFQTLVLISLIIWIIWLVRTFQVNLSIVNLNSTVIIGALLLFLQLILIGIKNNTIRDLKISEFKDITWFRVFTTSCLATVLSGIIVIAIKLINPTLITLKTNSSIVITQVVGGFVSGMVGFVSAMLVYNYQEQKKRRNEIKELTESLWFEISQNMLVIKGDLDRQFPFFSRLETNCWNAAISSKLSINGMAKGYILNLYGEISLYNDVHQIQRALLLEDKPINKNSLIHLRDKFPEQIFADIKKVNAILFGEMVRLGYRKKSDWIYSSIGIDWEKIYTEFTESCKKK